MGFFMYRNLIFLSLIFLLAWNVLGQELSHTYNKQLTIDNETAIDTFYIYFSQPSMIPGRTSGGGIKDDTTSNAENPVQFNGNLGVTIKLDSLKASTVLDSIWHYVQAFDKDKFPFGTKFYLDFTNNDSAAAVDYIEDAIPQNRDASDTPTTVTGWADLDNLISSSAHGIMCVSGMTNTAVADSVLVDINTSIGIPK